MYVLSHLIPSILLLYFLSRAAHISITYGERYYYSIYFFLDGFFLLSTRLVLTSYLSHIYFLYFYFISRSPLYLRVSHTPPLPGVRGVQETYGENIKKPNFARSDRGVKRPPGMGYIISIPPPGPPPPTRFLLIFILKSRT